jgi:hypothetical protein
MIDIRCIIYLTHLQLLEGLKEESQVEDSGKGGVGARSLTRSTRRVERRVGASGLN